MIKIIVTIPFGIIIMCLGLVISSVLCLYINAYYTKKHFNISLFQQIRNIFPSLLLSGSIGALIFLFTRLKLQDAITLVLGVSL